MLEPGAPAVLSGLTKRLDLNGSLATLVRTQNDESTSNNGSSSDVRWVCRLPKTSEERNKKYRLLTVKPQNLLRKGDPENLLDGSLSPSAQRPKELKVDADFVTCTQ